MKLEHLAPYLPYGLKCQLITENKIPFKTEQMTFLGEDWVDFEHNFTGFNFEYIKPILRPLSDLTEKECKRLLNDNLVFNFWYGKDKSGDYIYKEGYTSSIYRSYNGMPYWMIQHLLQWHFDVFGLIDEGLAIDINTLK